MPIVSGEIYHVFNRSVAKQPIFLEQRDYRRAIDVINFYRFKKPPLRFSFYKRLPQLQRQIFLDRLMKEGQPLVEILTYCIMPNHVHFLLKAQGDKSISAFMTNFQHSYSKYFNTKNKRTGSLFQAMFKAVRIESDEQLLHVSRYIHLNPASSFITKIDSLTDYHWSSFNEYLEPADGSFVSSSLVLAHFKTTDSYKEFVFNQADFQRKLDEIKHLVFE